MLRDKWQKTHGRRIINYARTILSILLGRAVELGILTANPVRDVKQLRRHRDELHANRPWTLVERQVAITHTPPHLRLPLVIALFTGMRVGDILRLPPTAIQDGRIKVRTAKRGIWIDIPVLPELRQALDAARANSNAEAITLCASSKNKPWTLNGFSSSFRKAMKKLEGRGLVGSGLTFHGLRHTVATVLAEAGVLAEDIAAVLGQSSSQMAAHYSREADRSRRTTAAIKKFKPLKATKKNGT
jgi:integrase